MKLTSLIVFMLGAVMAITAQDIVQVATNAGLTTLLQVVNLAGLAGPLTDGQSALTVLAPTNAAFTALGSKALSTVTASYNKDWLTTILLYHVFGARYPSSVVATLVGSNTPPTLQGSTIPVTQQGSSLFLGGAKVLTPDVPFLNGNKQSVVHVIDKVLVPPGVSLPGTITELVTALNGQGQFTFLFRALTEFGSTFTDLLDKFTENGFTIFAPTDAAFKELPARFRNFPLSRKCKQTVKSILRYHVVPRFRASASLKDNQRIKTLHGKTLDVDIKMGKVFIDGAKVVQPDIRAANGVIHVINEVLLP